MKKRKNTKRDFCFLLNPISGNGRNKKYCSEIMKDVLAIGNNIDVRTVELQRRGHASEIARQNMENENCTIVSVGGDGTLNEIASSLIYSNTPIAIVPRGSGNGLARTIGVPELKKQIAHYLVEGKIKPTDAGKINDKYFFCTCGFGFDAHIAAVFNKGKGRGPQKYVQSILKELLTYSPVEAEFTLDDKEYKGKFFIVTFANANQYGNNGYIAPNADISDGLLQATIIYPFPQVLAPMMGTALLSGYIDKMPYVETVTFKKAAIKSVSSPCFHCDGESLEMQYPTSVEVIEKAIKLIVPKGYRRKPIISKDKILLSLTQLIEKTTDTKIGKIGKIPHFNM
jgi:YegS/Rv2252/BmrU family lipid kinase